MRALLAALLLGIHAGATADGVDLSKVHTFERAEMVSNWDWDIPTRPGAGWSAVTLPHNWFRDPPPVRRAVWYRIGFSLEHAPLYTQSIYLARLALTDLTVYVNRQPIWRLREQYAAGTALTAVMIAVPEELLRAGDNEIHLEACGYANWYHGIPRVQLGNTRLLAAGAGTRRLVQANVIYVVGASFGLVGMLALWLWLRGGRDAVLFWYAIAGILLCASTAVWHWSQWSEAGGVRLALIFLRYNGYLMPILVLHLRLARLRIPWLEGLLWAALVAAVLSIAQASAWQSLAWSGWGILFAALPAFFIVPLLRSRDLRGQPAVLLLLVADVAAASMNLHDWALRIGWIDFDRPYLVYFVPLFMMLAAAVPIMERLMAGVAATRRMNLELERRVAGKAREIEASHERLREAQRAQALAEERRRIMADMHDGLGTRLVALLSVAQSGKAKHGEISEGLAAALDELRLTVDSVQPVEDDVGVVLGNVRHRMRSVFERAGVQLVWNVSELPRMEGLTPDRILAIQRIFLEAFANAIRHSRARAVSVFTLRVPGAVRIVIEDDGCGFDPAAAGAGTGLANLKLRATQAGGTLAVESQAGKGTRVTLSLPIAAGATSAALTDSGQETDDYPVRGISAGARQD